nr:glycosyltransferase 87 family protein [Propioniciclava soli]
MLLAPWALGVTDYDGYRAVIVALTSLADAAFAALLGRRTGPVGVLGWVALTTVLGQVALLRLDMLPAVAAGAAVLYAWQGRSAAASVLVGLGTGLKLWPVVLAPLVALAARGRRARAFAWFVGTGVLLAAGSLLAGGWDRLVSPLGYQGERGLQIESVLATWPMRVWASGTDHRVWYSDFRAFEVEGPSVGLWVQVGGVAAALAVLGCALLLARWLRRGSPRGALGPLALTFVGAFVITSPALSPQYLLWLAAPAAAWCAAAWGAEPEAGRQTPEPSGARGVDGRVVSLATLVALLVLCLLTTAVYPVFYGGLTSVNDHTSRALALLTARNLGLVGFVAWTAALARAATARG